MSGDSLRMLFTDPSTCERTMPRTVRGERGSILHAEERTFAYVTTTRK
jgi:hypothetical protein